MSDLAYSVKLLSLAIVVAAFVTEFGPCAEGSCVEPYATIGQVTTTAVLLGGTLIGAVLLVHWTWKNVLRRGAVSPSSEP